MSLKNRYEGKILDLFDVVTVVIKLKSRMDDKRFNTEI